MRKFIVLVLPVVAALGLATPAQATTTTVHLDVDHFVDGVIADCNVTVNTGSDGFDVLDEAIDTDCIDSYDTHPDFPGYVTCINDICEAPEAFAVVSWIIYVDGEVSPVGAGGLAFPDDGDTLGFNYEPWPANPCIVANVCL